MTEHLLRYIWTIGGAVLAVFEPTLPFMGVCTLMVLADCFTAWQLSRRVAEAYPDKVDADGHKFKSHHFGQVIVTLAKVYALILLAYMVQNHVLGEVWRLDLPRVAAAAVCFWQFWSILENESSCNGARWAKFAQRFVADKTKRHLNIDLLEGGRENTKH